MDRSTLRYITDELLDLKRRAHGMEVSIVRIRALIDATPPSPKERGIDPRDEELVRSLSEAASVDDFIRRIRFREALERIHGTEPTRFERLLGMAVDGASFDWPVRVPAHDPDGHDGWNTFPAAGPDGEDTDDELVVDDELVAGDDPAGPRDGARGGGGPFIVNRRRWEAGQPVVVHREDCPSMEGSVRRGLVAHVTRDDLARSGNGCRPCGTCCPDVPTRGGGAA